MEPTASETGHLVDASKQLGRRMVTIGENRLELLKVELQEAQSHLLRAVLLGCGMVACSVFALLALNVALVVLFWNYSPAKILALMAAIYAGAAMTLYSKLLHLSRECTFLTATLDQLRKDCACLEAKLT